MGTGLGVSPGGAAAAHCSPIASLVGAPELRRCRLWGSEGGEGRGKRRAWACSPDGKSARTFVLKSFKGWGLGAILGRTANRIRISVTLMPLKETCSLHPTRPWVWPAQAGPLLPPWAGRWRLLTLW